LLILIEIFIDTYSAPWRSLHEQEGRVGARITQTGELTIWPFTTR